MCRCREVNGGGILSPGRFTALLLSPHLLDLGEALPLIHVGVRVVEPVLGGPTLLDSALGVVGLVDLQAEIYEVNVEAMFSRFG